MDHILAKLADKIAKKKCLRQSAVSSWLSRKISFALVRCGTGVVPARNKVTKQSLSAATGDAERCENNAHYVSGDCIMF